MFERKRSEFYIYYSIHGVRTFDYLCMSIENNIFSCINDNREFHLPCGKGIMDGKHAIISYSPRNLQRQRDLMISFQKLLSLKIHNSPLLKNECPQTFYNDVLTYLRKTLQKLDPHFASNRCPVASFLNAQALYIET